MPKFECPEKKHDCFAADFVELFGKPSPIICKLLTESSKRKPCPFYKTRVEYLKGIALYGGERKESWKKP